MIRARFSSIASGWPAVEALTSGTRPWATVLLGLFILIGCDGAAKTNPANPTSAPSPTDLLVGAPGELPALLDWADEQLSVPPAAVPLPIEPTFAPARNGVVRLDDNLWRAQIACDWKPAEGSTRPLAELGPFRSDRPQREFRAQRRVDSDASGEAIGADISGFQVEREQVGSIAIELRVPFGRHFDLVWSRAGRLRIPLPDNQKFWKLTLPTDGFAEWTGALDKLSIVTDGVREGAIELRSLRFLPRQGSFLRPVGVRRVALRQGEARSTIYAHCPARIRFDGVSIPTNGKLALGLAPVSSAGPTTRRTDQPTPPADSTLSDAPLFDIRIGIDDGQGHVEGVFSASLAEEPGRWGDGRWRDVTASLAAFAGRTVSVVIQLSSAVPGTVALLGSPVIYEPVEDPPLVVVYLIDTLASEHIDVYGYSRATMPRLRELADNGAWFAEMFANAPRTIESIPNLFFSLPTERHGIDGPSVHAPQALVSLAEALRAAGFATASFCTNVNAGPRQALDQGFDSFFDRIGYYWTGEVVDRTVPIEDVTRWIADHRDRPMFVYVHTAEPHAPYTPPPEFAGRFSGGYTGRIDGTYDPQRGFQQSRDERDLSHVRALYDDEVTYADARLGAFLDALAAANLRDNLTIFVTADHGEEFQQHGAWEHGNNLFGEVLRIPLVAAGPAVTARGRIDVPVQLMDIMPTILDTHRVPPPYALSGQTLLPLLEGRARGSPTLNVARPIVSSNHNFSRAGVTEWSLIEDGRWKLLYNSRALATRSGGRPFHRLALFDLRADRAEQFNIIDEQPDVARRLIGSLIAWRRENPRFESSASDTRELDANQIRELQSLGYIGQ